MNRILAKEALKVIADLQTDIDKYLTAIPAQQYSAATKEEIAMDFDFVNQGCETVRHLATECLKGYDWAEDSIIDNCQTLLEVFNRARAMLWGSEADFYRVTFQGYNRSSKTETTAFFHDAFDILHNGVNARNVREGFITAVYKGDREPCIEYIFSSAIYYESMDEVAKTKRRSADTEHIKDMAIQISDAQLYFDAVVFEHDRAAYRERRKAARKAARKG